MRQLILVLLFSSVYSPFASSIPVHEDPKYGYKITPLKNWTTKGWKAFAASYIRMINS